MPRIVGNPETKGFPGKPDRVRVKVWSNDIRVRLKPLEDDFRLSGGSNMVRDGACQGWNTRSSAYLGEQIHHKVKLTLPADVDSELVNW